MDELDFAIEPQHLIFVPHCTDQCGCVGVLPAQVSFSCFHVVYLLERSRTIWNREHNHAVHCPLAHPSAE